MHDAHCNTEYTYALYACYVLYMLLSLSIAYEVHFLACVRVNASCKLSVKTVSRLVPLGRSSQSLSAAQLQLPASSRPSSCPGARLHGGNDGHASARSLLQANTQRMMRCERVIIASVCIGLTGQYACPSCFPLAADGRTNASSASERASKLSGCCPASK